MIQNMECFFTEQQTCTIHYDAVKRPLEVSIPIETFFRYVNVKLFLSLNAWCKMYQRFMGPYLLGMYSSEKNSVLTVHKSIVFCRVPMIIYLLGEYEKNIY